MDIATLLGIVVGLGLVVVSILIGEGVAGFKPFLNYEAFRIVMGGTFCAILVNYPIGQVFGLTNILKTLMTSAGEYAAAIITTFVNLARKRRTERHLPLKGHTKT